ncbi:MAG: carboxypeptidase-like regulatory domain-containing protein, partial [Planctomycetota bacterium]|nr:carboxypeptidase-like regulatory domain-containing protein [Planctomycetota bacterium]
AAAEKGGFYQRTASGTLVTITIPLYQPEDFRVWLHKPEPPQQVETRVLLAPFEKRHVTLTIPRSGSLHRGRVVDRDGRGIEGALVYFGDDCAGRGGEPFLTFREGWVSGVRSGAGGWFELTGQGPWISAFHPEHSSATVTADACDTIALGPRGALEGRLLDAQGEPLPMQRISFDHRYQHGPERLTDDEGRFTYDGLEAGTHGIWAADQQLFTFTVDAGEVARLDFQLPEGNLKLRMFREGRPHEVYELNGRLIGLDRTGTLTRLSHWRPRTSNPEELAVAEMPRMRRVASGPDPTTVDPVPPGRYLLVSAQGLTATFDVSGAEARVDLGLATLTVTGRPGQRVQVVPAGASTFVRVAAADSPVTLDDEGVFAFTVHPGNYEVVASGGHVLTRVEVSAQGASIAVDD